MTAFDMTVDVEFHRRFEFALFARVQRSAFGQITVKRILMMQESLTKRRLEWFIIIALVAMKDALFAVAVGDSFVSDHFVFRVEAASA